MMKKYTLWLALALGCSAGLMAATGPGDIPIYPNTNQFTFSGRQLTIKPSAVITNPSINGVSMTWPTNNAGGSLVNNGAGALTWSGSGAGGIWTNAASRVRLVTTNANSVLELGGNDGAGGGSVELWTAGSKRWTVNDAAIYPEGTATLGTSLNPVATLYLNPASGLVLGDRIVSSGSASPEGAHSGPVGSLFLRTDGASGTTLYTKTSGTNETGWEAVGGGNWTASGTTNSTLAGTASVNSLVVTNVMDIGTLNASLITAPGWSASKAVVTDESTNLVTAAVSATEVGYLAGVTSGIQSQIDGKLAPIALTTGTQTGGTNYYIDFDAGNISLVSTGAVFLASTTNRSATVSKRVDLLIKGTNTITIPQFGWLTNGWSAETVTNAGIAQLTLQNWGANESDVSCVLSPLVATTNAPVYAAWIVQTNKNVSQRLPASQNLKNSQARTVASVKVNVYNLLDSATDIYAGFYSAAARGGTQYGADSSAVNIGAYYDGDITLTWAANPALPASDVYLCIWTAGTVNLALGEIADGLYYEDTTYRSDSSAWDDYYMTITTLEFR